MTILLFAWANPVDNTRISHGGDAFRGGDMPIAKNAGVYGACDMPSLPCRRAYRLHDMRIARIARAYRADDMLFFRFRRAYRLRDMRIVCTRIARIVRAYCGDDMPFFGS